MVHLTMVAALMVVYVCMPQDLEGFSKDPGCDITKGCFGDCGDPTFCTFLVAWEDAGSSVVYTLTVASEWSQAWVAIGFSDDQQMGNDSVTGCQFFKEKTDVRIFNAKNHNHSEPEILPNEGVTLVSFSRKLSALNCTFTRVKEAGKDIDRFDLYQPWYLLFAAGSLSDQGVLRKHTGIFDPHFSDEKYDPAFKPLTTTVPTTTTDAGTTSTTTAGAQSTSETTTGAVTTVPTTPAQLSTPQPSVPSVIKVKGCGRLVGCYSDCVGLSCSFIISWHVDGKDAIYTVASTVARKASNWVAIGFSTDAVMGDDDVMGCISDTTGQVISFTGWNTKYRNPEMYTDSEIKLISQNSEDGLLSCTFRRPLAPASSGNRRVDVSQPLRLMFAKGPGSINKDNITISYHGKNRSVSTHQVSANDAKDLDSIYKEYPLVKTHGKFMITAWVLISSIGMITARYYKQFSGSRIFRGYSWLQAHMTCMLLVCASTAIGFVSIYIHSRGYSIVVFSFEYQYIQDKAFLQAHPIIGIIVMILVALNPCFAFLRPPPGSHKRPLFIWSHRIVGVSAHVLAVVNIFFGLQMDKSDVPFYLVYILAAYTIWQLLVAIVLEIVTWFGRKSYRLEVDETCQVVSEEEAIAEDSPTTLLAKKVIFWIHCTVLFCFTMALLVLLGMGNRLLVA